MDLFDGNRKRLMHLKSIFRFCLILFLLSCTKKGDFSSPACANGNSNCSLPSMQVEVVGSDNSTQSSVGNNGTVGSIEIKSVRYGEKIYIEFVLQNPKLVPLKNLIFTMSPGDSAFTVITSPNGADCGASDLLLLYSQKCSVTIDYKPGRIPPVTQNLIFNFKTLMGDDFIFEAKFDPATLLPDFYIDDQYLTLPETITFASTSGVGTEFDIPIENTGTDYDLANVQFLLNGSSEWTIATASTNACVQGQTLAKRGGTCSLRVKFTPTASGNKTASLVLVSGGKASREYTLTGLAKSISPDTTAVDFGAALVNSSVVNKTLTLSFPESNTGDSSSLCSYSLTGDSAFSTISNSCLGTQVAGSTCAINLRWTPSSQTTDHKGTFNWTCTIRGGSGSVNLSAKSVTSPLLTDKTQLEFGNVLVGSIATKTIQFSNLGSLGTLFNFGRMITGAGFSFVSTTCTDKLDPLSSCSAMVQFGPTQSGVTNASLSATSIQSDMDYPVVLTGTAQSVESNSDQIDFGLVGIGNDRPGSVIVITNPSVTESMSGCSLDYSTLVSQNFSLDSDSSCLGKTSLGLGATCTIKPRFTPILPEGSRTASINFVCSVGGSKSISLSGYSAVETRLVVAPPSHQNTNGHLVGTTNEIEFLLVNEHLTETANNLSVTFPDISFGWSVVTASANDCSSVTSLAPGETCRYRLRSSPSATPGSEQTGSYTGRISVLADGGNIDPPDGYFSSNNKIVTSNYTNYSFPDASVDTTALSDSITITNPSALDSASGCVLAVDGGFSILSTNCGAALSPLTSCSTRLKHDGSSTPVSVTGNLDYSCTVGGRSRTPVSLSIEALPDFIWSGSGNFGYLDTAAAAVQKTFTLTNNDSQSITLTSVGLSGGDFSYSVVSKTCSAGGTLVAGATCNVVVQFDTSDESSHFATLEAYGRRSSSTNTPQLSAVSLFGSGAHMSLSLSSSTFTFNDKEIGSATTEDKTLTITNNGTRPANLTYSSLSLPFSNLGTGTCGATLNPASSCTVVLRMVAAGTPGLSSATFTVTETSQGVATNSALSLAGTTKAQAALAIHDEVTSDTTTIATSDITGTLGDSRNLVDGNGGKTKTMTFTVTNNVANSGAVTLAAASLTYKSGTAGTMTITFDTCSSSLLAALATCTLIVTYTPTSDQQTSTFGLSLTGTTIAGGSLTVGATDVIGHSYKSATLVLSTSSYDFGYKAKGTTNNYEISIQNTGDYAATLNVPLFTATSSDLSATVGSTNPSCGATLAAGSSCYFTATFTPSTIKKYSEAVSLPYSYLVGASSNSKSATLNLDGASYVQLSASGFANSSYGREPDMAVDDSRAYVVSARSTYTTTGGSYSEIVLTICDLNTDGFVDANTSACGQTLFRNGTENWLVGTTVGAGPRIGISDHYIFIASNNIDPYYDDSPGGADLNTNGNSTVVVCKKPSVGTRTVTFDSTGSSDCFVKTINFSGSGNGNAGYPSISIVGSKLAISNRMNNGSTVAGFSISVCTIDDSSAAPSGVISDGNCQSMTKDLGNASRAQMGDLGFDGNRLVFAAYNNVTNENGLYITSCSVHATTNAITCDNHALVANTSFLASSSPDVYSYAGSYPSVVISGDHYYIAHQQGENTFRNLLLTSCNFDSANHVDSSQCSTQTVAQRQSGSQGLGLYPHISVVGSNLWISNVGSNSDTDMASFSYSEIRMCKTQLSGAPDCGTFPQIFTHQNFYTLNAQFLSRGHYVNSTKKIMLLPQTMTSNKIGILSVGLPNY